MNWKNKLVSSNPDLNKVLSRHLPARNPPNEIASIESVISTIRVQSVAARPPSCVAITLKVTAMDWMRTVNREAKYNYHVSYYYTWHYSLVYRRRNVSNIDIRLGTYLTQMSDKYRLRQNQKLLRYKIITSKMSYMCYVEPSWSKRNKRDKFKRSCPVVY